MATKKATTKKSAKKKATGKTTGRVRRDRGLNKRSDENIKAAVEADCCRKVTEKVSDYDMGFHHGQNRAISEHPIASRSNQLEGLRKNLEMFEEEMREHLQLYHVYEARRNQTQANIARLENELRALTGL
jgi:hypothetical protein